MQSKLVYQEAQPYRPKPDNPLFITNTHAPTKSIHRLPDLHGPLLPQKPLELQLRVQRDVLIRHVPKEVPGVRVHRIRSAHLLAPHLKVHPLPLVPQPVEVRVVEVEERVTGRRVHVPDVTDIAADTKVSPSVNRHAINLDPHALEPEVKLAVRLRGRYPVRHLRAELLRREGRRKVAGEAARVRLEVRAWAEEDRHVLEGPVEDAAAACFSGDLYRDVGLGEVGGVYVGAVALVVSVWLEAGGRRRDGANLRSRRRGRRRGRRGCLPPIRRRWSSLRCVRSIFQYVYHSTGRRTPVPGNNPVSQESDSASRVGNLRLSPLVVAHAPQVRLILLQEQPVPREEGPGKVILLRQVDVYGIEVVVAARGLIGVCELRGRVLEALDGLDVSLLLGGREGSPLAQFSLVQGGSPRTQMSHVGWMWKGASGRWPRDIRTR